MSVTILYRHPQRPDEAGMTCVGNDADAAALKDQLERRGFEIVKMTATPETAISGRVRSPPNARSRAPEHPNLNSD
jgi:hypothetical protein